MDSPDSFNSLKLYDTLTRTKRWFVSCVPEEVRLYVCGMTVYDYCHIGHARVMVVFDMVQRWLRTLGYRVTYVRNITDIDDKIIQRAKANGESISKLTDRFIQAMHEDAKALGVECPDREPRATEYVSHMLRMIETLAEKGYAYQTVDSGDVYYAVRKFADYGKLSGKSLDDLCAGERVAVDDDKRDPLDFVLWKATKPDDPQEAIWDSKWGCGRPGWHIECSAMSSELLGESFDIHGGGEDLQFPHHENEIAQSQGASGQPFAHYWMHNGYVQVDDEKMSKSLGNFYTIREVLEKEDPEVVRFFILRAHYRSPLNYSDAHLVDARQALSRLYTALKNTAPDDAPLDWTQSHAIRFRAAMNDDFNTPNAIAVLFELATALNKTHDPTLARQFRELARVLGLLTREPSSFFQTLPQLSLSMEEITQHITEREAAREMKRYERADEIRAILLNAGVLLEDKPDGTTEWRRM